jgi:hypothetical protein
MNDNTWPRIYCTTMAERLTMPQAELEQLWREYREYWRDAIVPTSRPIEVLDLEYSKDWLEDKEGTYR